MTDQTVHQPLTDQQLDEIAGRAQAAEDGWHVVVDEADPYRHEIHGDGPTHVAVFGGNPDDGFASYPVEANAEFAAHAREDVPALVAEVRRLRAELADFSGRVNELESKLCDCEAVREHNDYKRPAFYQHEPHCPVNAPAAVVSSAAETPGSAR